MIGGRIVSLVLSPGLFGGLKQVPLRTADLGRQLDAKEQEPFMWPAIRIVDLGGRDPRQKLDGASPNPRHRLHLREEEISLPRQMSHVARGGRQSLGPP